MLMKPIVKKFPSFPRPPNSMTTPGRSSVALWSKTLLWVAEYLTHLEYMDIK